MLAILRHVLMEVFANLKLDILSNVSAKLVLPEFTAKMMRMNAIQDHVKMVEPVVILFFLPSQILIYIHASVKQVIQDPTVQWKRMPVIQIRVNWVANVHQCLDMSLSVYVKLVLMVFSVKLIWMNVYPILVEMVACVIIS